MIFNGEKERRAVKAEYDYIIVGSGAAGATAARTLSDTGATIAIVEEGPAVDTKEFDDKVWPVIAKLFRNQGSTIARGRAMIPLVQGTCLGGSTVINSAIIWRIPDDVWQPWKTEYGLGDALSLEQLHGHWDQIERELNIHPVLPEVWGENNRLMQVGADAMGVAAEPIRRGDKGCKGSARCLTGCPHGAKQSMLVSYLPYAMDRGADVYTSARVDKVQVKGDRAMGVKGYFHVTPFKKNIAPFELRAKKGVIVAASAVQTPGLLERSGVRSDHLGRHFQAHPGAPLLGVFDQKVNLWFGATQGYDAHHHRKDLRVKIETIGLPPEMMLTRAPGVGRRWVETMTELPHATMWAVQMRAHAKGRIRERLWGTDATYDLTDQDMINLRKGLRFTAEMMFAAGAREIILGIPGLPERIKSVDQAVLLENGPSNPAAYSFIASHLFGTARMSLRPGDGVVGADFAVHGTKNFYVLDSSIFPTNLGVNPQHAIMGVAMMAAGRIARAQA
jgi:choline dehydrogenase-like flavoprotein